MKTIFEHDLGPDGAKGGLYLEKGSLVAKVSTPVNELVDRLVAPLDPLKEQLKAAIPGDWDNSIIDGIFNGAKAEITKLLSE